MTTTNLVHFARAGRFICIAARAGETQTTDAKKVTCRGCLKALIRDARPGTKLASALMVQLAGLK